MAEPQKPGAPEELAVAMGTEAPPSYDATNQGQDAPPSYNSIFGQLKDVKEKNSNPVGFMGGVMGVLLNTLCATIFLALILTIPIAMIVIGAIYIDDCPRQYLIPIYLITMGSVYVFKSIIDFKIRAQKSKLSPEEQENFKPGKIENFLTNLIGLFVFAFFIAGNIWIYSIYAPNTRDSSLDDYCHPVLYYFAFWVTTATYICIALCCCCCCFAGCVAFMCGSSD